MTAYMSKDDRVLPEFYTVNWQWTNVSKPEGAISSQILVLVATKHSPHKDLPEDISWQVVDIEGRLTLAGHPGGVVEVERGKRVRERRSHATSRKM